MANYRTAEDLQSWLAEYPFAPLQDIEVIRLVDVDKGLDKAPQVSRQTAAMLSGSGQ